MNYFNLTALLAEAHRAELRREAERYRRTQGAKARARAPMARPFSPHSYASRFARWRHERKERK
jgi:hypothetical protein